MRERLHNDKVMMSKLIPSYQPWCRRLTPGDAYLEALLADNAALIDDPITKITKMGVVTKSASEQQYIDVLVLATGFHNYRVPPWNMRGIDWILLSDLWVRNPDDYLSGYPQMPNYFLVGYGPNFIVANGPLLSVFGFMSEYVFKWALKMAGEDIKSVTVKSNVKEACNAYIQEP